MSGWMPGFRHLHYETTILSHSPVPWEFLTRKFMHILRVSPLLRKCSLGDGRVCAFFLGFEDMHFLECNPLHCSAAWPWDQVFVLIPESYRWIQGSRAGRALHLTYYSAYSLWSCCWNCYSGHCLWSWLMWMLLEVSLWNCFWHFLLVPGSLELKLYRFLLAQSPIYNFFGLKRVHPRTLIFCPFLTQFYPSTSECVEFIETLLSFKVMEHLSNDSNKLWECRPC